MKKIFSLILALIFVFPVLVSCGGNNTEPDPPQHEHQFRTVEHKPTCTEDGYTEYICDCGYSYKENIVKATGHDYEKKDYSLFLGSSIFHGHLEGYSFVDMMKEDYVKVTMNGKTKYYKRNKELQDTGNFGENMVFRCDKDIVTVSHDKTFGQIGLRQVEFIDNGKNYDAIYNGEKIADVTISEGDKNVYKLTANGASMAFFTPSELVHTGDEYERRSYWYRLTNYGKDIEKVNNFYLQLSTNDASWATKGDVNFGEVLPEDKKNLQDFDYTTSFGAMEYMIAFARQKWNCRITIVICPYITMSGEYGRLYSQLVEKVPLLQKKWNVGVLDLYHDEEIYKNVTNTDTDWLNKYMYPDRVHLTALGYESWILPKVRGYVEKEGWQTGENGEEFRICGVCGHKEIR